jgi:hypothetical protein
MKNDDPVSGSTITGTGEFWRRDIHIVATVEVHDGVIRSLGFAFDDGRAVEGADEVVSQLTDHTVHDALEVHADPGAVAPDSQLGIAEREVLFEAFHRAVEACLDHQ